MDPKKPRETLMENSSAKAEVATEFTAQAPLSAEYLAGSWRVKPMLNRIEELEPDAPGFAPVGARSLEPRLMHLLCYLAANSGRVLSRDELVEELWPNVIVNENSLTRAVSELRKQLSTSRSQVNDYIETIPKKGYRLTAKLTLTTSIDPLQLGTTLDADSNSPPLLPGSLRNALITPGQQASLLATACLSLVLGLWLWQSTQILPAAVDAIQVTTAQLSDEVISSDHNWIGGELTLSNSLGNGSATELEQSLAFSNDQQKLAYIHHNPDSSTIFVASVDNLAMAYPVFTSDEKLYNLRWSPVGESLLFASKSKMTTAALFSTDPDPAKLMMVDVNTLEAVELMNQESEPESGEVMSLT